MENIEGLLAEVDELTRRLKPKGSQLTASQRADARLSLWSLLLRLEETPHARGERAVKGLWRLCQGGAAHPGAEALGRLNEFDKAGVPEATYRLGMLHRDSRPRRLQEAIGAYIEADRRGHERAAFDLGFVFMRFRDSAPSDERLGLARSWFERAATEFDDAEACAHLSIMYRHGLGVETNLAKARLYLERALRTRNGNNNFSPRAHASYGLECMQAGQFDKALRHLLIASTGGAPRGDAMLNAARILLRGGASEDGLTAERITDPEAKAYELLHTAATMYKEGVGGFDYGSRALYELSRLQTFGRGCRADEEAAFTNMRKAADLGHLPALRLFLEMLSDRGMSEEMEHYAARVQMAFGHAAESFAGWASDNYSESAEAQISFFEEISSLVEEGEYEPALTRIAALYRWADLNRTKPYARRAVHDAGVRYLFGLAKRGLGQIEEAIAEFERSARARDDFKHQSMCYSAMAECAEFVGDHDRAANYYYKGFLVSKHAHMWIRHARAVFRHNPARRVVALQKIEAFIFNYKGWRESDSQIMQFPLDLEPHKTWVAYADLLWQLPLGGEPESLVDRSLTHLLLHLRARARENRTVDLKILQCLARGALRAPVRAEIAALIEHIGLADEAPEGVQQAFPNPLLGPDKAVVILRTLRDGLGRARGYTADVAHAVIRRIGRTPDLIVVWPELGQALAHMLWRCVVQAYYRESKCPSHFRDDARGLLLPLVAIFHRKHGLDPALLHDWMFELVAADKASVEYGLVADFLGTMREQYLDPYTGSLGRVAVRLRREGSAELRALAQALVTPEVMLGCNAFGDLACDTAQYAGHTVTQYVKHLLHHSARPYGVTFYVEHEAPINGQLLVSTASRIDLALMLSRLFGSHGAAAALLRGTRHVILRAQWVGKGMLRMSFVFAGSARVNSLFPSFEASIREITKGHGLVISEIHPNRNNKGDMVFRLDCKLASSNALQGYLGDDWREYLIALIREHAEFRASNVADPNFFESLRSQMPQLAEGQTVSAVQHAERWALIVHAVCDRFHIFFAGSLLRDKHAERSPIGALHDLKKALALMHEKAVRRELDEGDLVRFRQRVRALEPLAEQLLKGSLSGWRHSWFDLRAEFDRRAGLLDQVFARPEIEVRVLGRKEVLIKAPKEQVLLGMRELLANARDHSKLADGTPTVIVEFQNQAIVIRNEHPGLGAKSAVSTGKGVMAARGWLEGCGMPFVAGPIDGSYGVRVSLPALPRTTFHE